MHYIAQHSPEEVLRLLGYMAKADSPATKKLFAETVMKSKETSVFLRALNCKNIMTGGLTTAAIIFAYKVSDGLQEGVKNPEAAKHVTIVVKSIGWSIAIWRKSKSKNKPE